MRDSLCLSDHGPVQAPAVGDTFELVFPSLFEGEATW